MVINGKSILLRTSIGSDLEYYREWWSNLELMRSFDQIPPMTYFEIEQEYKKNLASPNRLDFIIEDKSNKPLGTVFLKNINWINRNAEQHILIADPACQNLGFGIEAQYYILKHAFHQLNMHKLYGRILEYASGIIKSLEMVGYKKEAVCKNVAFHNGKYWDLFIYGLLSDEFTDFLNHDNAKYMEYAKTN